MRPSPADLQFGSFRLSLGERRLLQNDQEVPLTPKAFDTLQVLATNAGQLVEKQDLMKAVWGEVFVDESTLTQNIFTIRKALGDGVYIETVPRRGYRFTALVTTPELTSAGLAARSVVWTRKRPLTAAAIAVVAILAAAAWWMGRSRVQAPGSIVVLPFLDLTAGSQMQYLADGLTEDVIGTLASGGALRVVARTTAFHYKNLDLDIREVGKQLNVGAVLEGSIRTEGDRIRVSAQLNNAVTGYHYWSRTFERPVPEVYALSHDIALATHETLGGGPLKDRPATVDPEAYRLYLQGTYEGYRYARVNVLNAAKLFQAAIDKDPSYARAYAALAWTYTELATNFMMPHEEAFTKARTALRKAAALDPAQSLVHTIDGKIKMLSDWDWDGAEREIRQAIKLDPGDPETHHSLAHILEVRGRNEEAKQAIHEARRLDPFNATWLSHESHQYWFTGRTQQAIDTAREALKLDPNHYSALSDLMSELAEAGQFNEAFDVWVQLGLLTPQAIVEGRARVAAEGPKGYWRWNLERWEKSTALGRSYRMAQYSARLGDRATALRFLEKAYGERSPRMVEIPMDPAFASLHAEPRFMAIVERMNL